MCGAFLGGIGIRFPLRNWIVLFVVIVLLQGLFYSMQEGELKRKVYSQTSEELRALDADQLKQLNSYGWVSEPDGVAHIPIERAMDLVAQEAGGRPLP